MVFGWLQAMETLFKHYLLGMSTAYPSRETATIQTPFFDYVYGIPFGQPATFSKRLVDYTV